MAWSRPGVFVLPLLLEHRRTFQAMLFSLRREGTTVMCSSSSNVCRFSSGQRIRLHLPMQTCLCIKIFVHNIQNRFWHLVLERLVISPLLHRCSVSRVTFSCLLQLAFTCSEFNDILCPLSWWWNFSSYTLDHNLLWNICRILRIVLGSDLAAGLNFSYHTANIVPKNRLMRNQRCWVADYVDLRMDLD